MCNGLMVPIVACDQIYSFDRDALIKTIPRPEDDGAQFNPAAEELFNSYTADGQCWRDGRTSRFELPHHALSRNLCEGGGRFERDFSLSGVDVRPSLSRTRKLLDVIFATNATDFTRSPSCGWM
jgi:hypothetical protein